MTTVHYFPRYSQKENAVTNNVLLLFSRLYHNSPEKFRRFTNTILEESGLELNTTVSFQQQMKSAGSVPDGCVAQESFKIIIETKLYGQKNQPQISNHLKAFDTEDKQVLLWIDTNRMDQQYRRQVESEIRIYNTANKTRINLATATFADICNAFEEVLNEYDFEMRELADDFRSFCQDERLLDSSDTRMRVILASSSLDQNVKYKIYYAPRDRGYQSHKYLGLYKDKAVRALGELVCIADIDCDPVNRQIVSVKVEKGHLTPQQKSDVQKVVADAAQQYGWQIESGHRFFFVDEYYLTEYSKVSKGGLWGQRYFALDAINGYRSDMTAQELASFLKGKAWE